MTHGRVTPERFRQVLGHVPTPVTVITAMTDAGPVGLAVGAFFSVSLAPPLVGWCPTKTSSSWPGIRLAGSFCVNVLAHDQGDICGVFATSGGDKFRGQSWTAGSSGAPRLDGVLAWIDCDIDAIHDAGDHELCIGRVRDLEIAREVDPMVFHVGGYRGLVP